MISQFFSTQSRKAWVAGLVAIALTPLIQLLSTNGEITLRVVLVALLNGVISAVAVYATGNEKNPAELPVEKAAVAVAAQGAVAAVEKRAPGVNVAPLEAVVDDSFAGQTVEGE